MIKIYGVMKSRANRCLWAAEEAGLRYQLIATDYSKGDAKTEAFMKINPNGRVPAMQDGDFLLFESFAINAYLVKKSGCSLAPKDIFEDALMLQWAMWAMFELERHALDAYDHSRNFPESNRNPRVLEAARAALRKPLGVLESAVSSGYLVGGRFTVADLNVASVLLLVRGQKELLADFPQVAAFLEAARQRPAFKTIFARG